MHLLCPKRNDLEKAVHYLAASSDDNVGSQVPGQACQ